MAVASQVESYDLADVRLVVDDKDLRHVNLRLSGYLLAAVESSLLDVAGRRSRVVLHQLEVHGRTRPQGSVSLSGYCREAEEHVVRGAGGDPTDARAHVEGAHHPMLHREAVCARRRRSFGPFSLGDADAFDLGRVVCFVAVV